MKLKKLCSAASRQFRVPITQTEFRNRRVLLGSYEPEKQPPTVSVGQHGVTGRIALLHQPLVEEGVQQIRKGSWLHAFPPVEVRRA
jgi:hypothetical protein